jgi:hypothetical protein
LPTLRFGTTPDDLRKNKELLEKHGFDLAPLLAAHRGTTVDPGSEFRPPARLESFLSDHPLTPYRSKVFTDGMGYEVTREPWESERKEELGRGRDGMHPPSQGRQAWVRYPGQRGLCPPDQRCHGPAVRDLVPGHPVRRRKPDDEEAPHP